MECGWSVTRTFGLMLTWAVVGFVVGRVVDVHRATDNYVAANANDVSGALDKNLCSLRESVYLDAYLKGRKEQRRIDSRAFEEECLSKLKQRCVSIPHKKEKHKVSEVKKKRRGRKKKSTTSAQAEEAPSLEPPGINLGDSDLNAETVVDSPDAEEVIETPAEELAAVEPDTPAEELAAVEPDTPAEELAAVEPDPPAEELAATEPSPPAEEPVVAVEPDPPKEVVAAATPNEDTHKEALKSQEAFSEDEDAYPVGAQFWFTRHANVGGILVPPGTAYEVVVSAPEGYPTLGAGEAKPAYFCRLRGTGPEYFALIGRHTAITKL